MLARALGFTALAVFVAAPLLACSSGVVNVGSTQEQELTRTTDGGATGNGQTCSFDDVVWYDGETGQSGTVPSKDGTYEVGDTFKAPDGCNDCTCTAEGIACTKKACTSPGNPGCTEEARQCPDGSFVVRTGPSCEFAPCPGEGGCTVGGKHYAVGEGFVAPDGCNSCSCTKDGVACTAMACPPANCTEEAMLCPDGKTYVSRTGPNCEFAPCP